MPKFKLAGASWTSVPVPCSEIVCGLLGALSVIEIEPVTVPIVVGLKVTDIVQLLPGFTVAPQFEVSPNGPLIAPFEIYRVPRPVFVSVTVCALLVVPTS